MAQLCGVAAFACVVAAAISDVRRFEIPDGLSIAIVLLFVPFAFTLPAPADALLHVAVGVLVFLLGAGLFAAGWMGGGDVKLLGACALWAGTGGFATLLGGMTVGGGALAAAALVGRRLVGGHSSWPALRHGGPIPYAVAILGGAAMLLAEAA